MSNNFSGSNNKLPTEAGIPTSTTSISWTSTSWLASFVMKSAFNVSLTEEEIQEELRNPGSITRGKIGPTTE